ncbi:hypothetical protein Pdw03_6879 [Penicillium digitatum]|uniref:Uncharacterized protein n=1 Tax=Penicillium digitatum TaxID=36651 RepID=A0A7T6XKS4_PENDI|nr:hypothetical protein Pdw03_6879 [Penicillium digitatum]
MLGGINPDSSATTTFMIPAIALAASVCPTLVLIDPIKGASSMPLTDEKTFPIADISIGPPTCTIILVSYKGNLAF